MTQPTKLIARVRGAALCAALFFCAGAAHADLWGYVDEQGVTHFASEQVDERYELYYKGTDAEPVQSIDNLALKPSLGLLDARGRAILPPSVGLSASAKSTPALKMPAPTLPTRFARIESSAGYKSASQHMRRASKAHGVDYALIKAVIAAESGFNTAAVSPKGAVGLMQLMPTTAQAMGVKADDKNSVEQKLTDPATNVAAGTRYLNYLLKMFSGNVELAVAAYNAGEGSVKRAGNQVPRFRETQNYVQTVLQLYSVFKPGGVSTLAADAGSERDGSARSKVKAGASGRVRAQLGGR